MRLTSYRWGEGGNDAEGPVALGLVVLGLAFGGALRQLARQGD